jgi:hypothetical protein
LLLVTARIKEGSNDIGATLQLRIESLLLKALKLLSQHFCEQRIVSDLSRVIIAKLRVTTSLHTQIHKPLLILPGKE